jgi:hypothetical protein
MNFLRLFIIIMTLFFGLNTFVLAGTSPGKISCSTGDFSFEGIVPGDSIEINVKVKSNSNSVVLIDDLTLKQLDSSEKEEMKGIPQKLVEIGDNRNPFDGVYLLKVHGNQDKKIYLNVIATSKKPVKFSLPKSTEFSFPATFEFKINELNKGKAMKLKNVGCNWTYENP